MAMTQWKSPLSLLFKGAIVLCLILAFFGLSLPLAQPGGDRIYILDGSRSFQAHHPQAFDFISQSLKDLSPPEDKAALVVFGQRAGVERSFSQGIPRDKKLVIESLVGPEETNIAEGLKLAQSLARKDRSTQFVLISDGHQTLGRAQVGEKFSSHLWVRTYRSTFQPEVEILDVEAPTSVERGENFVIQVSLRGEKGKSFLLQWEKKGKKGQQRVDFDTSYQSVTLPMELKREGFHKFRFRLPATGEEQFCGIWCQRGIKKILWLATSKKRPQLNQALDFLPPDANLPRPLSQHYSLVVTDNLPYDSLSPSLRKRLVDYLQNWGGSLFVIGGKESFGRGGYVETDWEKVLPVISRPREKSLHPLALVLALDLSGSMGNQVAGRRKWDRAVENVFPLPGVKKEDRLAVITFAQQAQIRYGLAPLAQRKNLAGELIHLRPSGGTDLFSPFPLAYSLLKEVRKGKKHILLVTDGEGKEGKKDMERLFGELRKSQPQVKITVFLVGSSPEGPLLNYLATQEEVKILKPKSFSRLKSLLQREIRHMRSGSLFNREFRPQSTYSPLQWTEKSTIKAHLITSARPEARVLLYGPRRRPVLAFWNYGLGRVAALTTSWGKPWWPEMEKDGRQQKFLQSLAPLLKEKIRRHELSFRYERSKGVFEVEAWRDGRFLNGLELKARLGKKVEMTFEPIAPGRYRGKVPPIRPGLYSLVILEKSQIAYRSAVYIESRERNQGEPNFSLLRKISHGKVIESARQLPPPGGKKKKPWDLSTFFLLLALGLFVFEEVLARWR